jgi:hypothetical protein
VLKEQVTNSNKTLSLKSLAKGVYYVQIRKGTEVVIQKLIKQ